MDEIVSLIGYGINFVKQLSEDSVLSANNTIRGATFRKLLNITLALATLPKDDVPMCSDVVDAPAGHIVGTERTSRDGRIYDAFFGIPYAQPPLGKLRFEPPEPIEKFKTTFEATVISKNCLQNLDPNSSEDCLYLNVFRPKPCGTNAPEGRLPVLFYVYGGAFSAGTTGPVNNADYLMDEDVILVSPNYRVGILGFPSFANDIMPGNYGLKDLVLALNWVKDNISAFGGDPDNVTVFGGSAGGAMSQILMKSPASEKLVTRAYSYSGTINPIWSLVNAETVKNGTLQVAQHVKCCKKHENCAANRKVFRCMQKVNASDLLKGATILSTKTGIGHLLPFTAVIEPNCISDAVITEDLSQRPSKKPWMTSVTTGEFSVFLDLAETMLSNQTVKYLGSHSSVACKYIIGQFTNSSEAFQRGSAFLKERYFQGDFSKGLAQLFMDMYFIYPQVDNIRRHEGPKWMSSFEYKGELSLGRFTYPGHADQGVFIFNYRDLYTNVQPQDTEEDYKVIKRMIRYLTNFAKYSDPTPWRKNSTCWEKFVKNEVFRITPDGDYMAGEKFFKHYEDIYLGWRKIIDGGNRTSST